MKFTNRSFLYYFSNILLVIGFYFYFKSDDFDKAELIYIPLIAVSLFLSVFNIFNSSKKRAANLNEYARQNNFVFAEKPAHDQIAEFKSFKSIKGIASSFSNILVPEDSSISNRGIKPKIITGRKASEGQNSTEFFTQIFLYEIDNPLPIFYLSSKSKLESLMPLSNKISVIRKNNLDMRHYQKIEIDSYDFPAKRYDLYSPDLNAKNVFNREFIDLLKTGIKKNVSIHIESNGKKLIFFVKNQRHSPEGLDFYINLFEVMISKLKNRF